MPTLPAASFEGSSFHGVTSSARLITAAAEAAAASAAAVGRFYQVTVHLLSLLRATTLCAATITTAIAHAAAETLGNRRSAAVAFYPGTVILLAPEWNILTHLNYLKLTFSKG